MEDLSFHASAVGLKKRLHSFHHAMEVGEALDDDGVLLAAVYVRCGEHAGPHRAAFRQGGDDEYRSRTRILHGHMIVHPGRTVGEVVPNSASAKEITDLWIYIQDRLSRIVRDPTLLPDFKPSHLSINSLLAPTEENAAEVAAKAAEMVAEAAEAPVYEGPERRVVGERPILDVADLPPELRGQQPPGMSSLSLADTERDRMLAALGRHNGRKAAAAAELGISRSTLWRRLYAYRLR